MENLISSLRRTTCFFRDANSRDTIYRPCHPNQLQAEIPLQLSFYIHE
jgi:hypothetical protein